MKNFPEKTCPQCGYHRIKTWNELSDDEKILVEKLPASARFTKEARKKHRFCSRCWFEDADFKSESV